MTLTALNAMILMNVKLEIITVMPMPHAQIPSALTHALVITALLETVVTVLKLRTLVTLAAVKMLTVKKHKEVKVDGQENNQHANVTRDIKVIHSSDALILMSVLLTRLVALSHVVPMKNVTITMVVSNVNALLVTSASTANASTLMNALPITSTFVIPPKDSALITMAVTHVRVK